MAFFGKRLGKGPLGLVVSGHHVRPSFSFGPVHFTTRSVGVRAPGIGYVGGRLPHPHHHRHCHRHGHKQPRRAQ
jgi:hypothetical protein